MDRTSAEQSSVNKLTNETSTYLLQHASNPVNWYPWGASAIELARKQDKPILLSIGYSSCHWCHVMMHESFEDPEVAATMNRLFINIKVDKQERPDLDKVYQTAHQLLMGQPGGWPLTIFLSPDTLIPYYSGTYFPKDALPEIPDFKSLLHRLNEVYYHAKEKIKQQEAHTLAIIQVIYQPRSSNELPLAENLLHAAEISIQNEFDPINGGFGEGAKFPNCPSLDFLLHSKEPLIRHIALTTLKNMAERGIYDQVAGGFFRYTVDEQWHIPHFEKMLYDNAQLISLYAKAYHLTNNQYYSDIAIDSGAWLVNTLREPATNGFYSSLDADSDGEEGLYYTWDLQEIKAALNPEEFAQINKFYSLDHRANFGDRWHLITNQDCAAPSTETLAQIKQKLLQLRLMRAAPNVDKIILTSWNGLVIKAFSEAGQILQNEEFLTIANQTIEFVQQDLFVDQQLYATWQNGKPKIAGFLDDYAFVLDGILIHIADDQQHKHLDFCKQLADGMISKFYDVEQGGFFFTSHQAEELFYRPKTYTDDVIPSGNGIACLALLKLGRLIKNDNYIDIACKSIYAAQAYLNDAPEIHLSMALAYELQHLPQVT